MTATPILDTLENRATAVRKQGVTTIIKIGERMVVESREIGRYSWAVFHLVDGEFRREWPEGRPVCQRSAGHREANVANVDRGVPGSARTRHLPGLPGEPRSDTTPRDLGSEFPARPAHLRPAPHRTSKDNSRVSFDDERAIYRIPLPAHPIAARQARQVMVWALRSWDLRRLSQAASLVLTELVTNALARTHEPIMLTLTRHDDQLLIEVRDDGDGLPQERTPGDDSENGRGPILVHAYSTTWDFRVEENGKTVWALLGP